MGDSYLSHLVAVWCSCNNKKRPHMSAQDQKTKAPEPPAETLTPVQLARLVGVHRATLYRWMDRPKMEFPAPTIKVGRTVRWLRVDYEQWLAKQKSLRA